MPGSVYVKSERLVN